jgi:hypothetical protein
LGLRPGELRKLTWDATVGLSSPQSAARSTAIVREVMVPTIRGGATVMDSVFGPEDDKSA